MSTNVELNRKLLEFAEIKGDELEAFLPKWMEATEKMKLSDAEVEYALNTYIPMNWDVQYKGVRMMVGCFFREIVDLVVEAPKIKAAGKPVVYGIIPCVPLSYYVMKAACPEAFITFPDFMLVNTINSFFHNADTARSTR